MISPKKRLIVVLGMHRSGTSTITCALNVLGVALGDRLQPPIDGINAKGFFEDIDLNALNIEMLQAIDSDWHCLAPLESSDIESLRNKGYFLRAVHLLRKKTADVSIFGFKDPRVAKLLPFWHQVFAHCGFDIGYVLAIRNPLSVVQSLAKRDEFRPEKSYILWLGHVLTSLLHTEKHRRVLVDYDHFLNAPQQDLELIAERLALQIDPQALNQYQSEFLDEGLRHTVYAANDLAIDQACPPLVQEVYAKLIDVSRDNRQLDNPAFHVRTALWADEFNRIKMNLRWIDSLLAQIARLSAQIDSQNQSVNTHDGEITDLIRAALELDKNTFQKSFDPEWYLNKYPDVAAAGIDPYIHYISAGVLEGRLPSADLTSFVRQGLLGRLKELNAITETQLFQLTEREKTYSQQLQEIQQAHEQQNTEQSHRHVEHEQALQLEIEATREELRQAMHESRELQRVLEAEIIQTRLNARDEADAQLRMLAERERAFAEQLSQLQQAASQERAAQMEAASQERAAQMEAASQELAAQMEAASQELAALKDQYSRLLFDLNNKLGAIQSTWTWRSTAPLRGFSELFGNKSDFSPIDPLQLSAVFAPEEKTENPTSKTISAAKTLDELLAHDDEAFVTCAYLTLLGRTPDPQGFSCYMEHLKKTGDKLAIIYRIYRGQEARQFKNNIAGLEAAMNRQKWKQIPILGFASGLFIRGSNQPAPAITVNASTDTVSSFMQPVNEILQDDGCTVTRSSKTAVFTIASKNYLAYVRVLLTSVAKLHPEYDLYLCLVDRVDGYFDPANEPFTVIQADQIGIPTFDDMALRYDIMEFNTAVKPFMFQWLFKNTDLDAVIYLDPDIRAYSRFESLEKILEAGAAIVLTPHITRPLEDGKIPNDYHMLQAGVFNLGFIAAHRCKESLEFLAWWSRRLTTQAVSDIKNNLFTDQKWCDLAPCFLDKLYILKDPGHNAAYWNLAQRKVTVNANSEWRVNDSPLVFFHFSGVNADKKNVVSKHQNRLEWVDIPQCRALFEDYFRALNMHGWEETKKWPYAYSQVFGGISLPSIVRLLYRAVHTESLSIEPSDVAAVLGRLCNEPAEGMPSDEGNTITRLMYFIYTLRDDLRAAFNLGTPAGRRQFVSWFTEAGPREYGLPNSVICQLPFSNLHAPGETGNRQPVAVASPSEVGVEQHTKLQEAAKEKQELTHSENHQQALSALNASSAPTSTVRNIKELLSLGDAAFVTCAYLTLLGRIPDYQGRLHYLKVLKNGMEKLEIIYQIYRSPESRQRNANVSGVKIAILHRIWLLLPKVMRKPVEHALSKHIACGLPTEASAILNSTSNAPQYEQECSGSKIDSLDQPAEVPQLLGDQYISNLMYLIWQSRPDIQQAFDLMTEAGQKGFAAWYQASAHTEYGLKDVVPKQAEVKPIRGSNAPYALQGAAGANLIGYAHAELGMGEHVRMTAAALTNTDTAFNVVNFNVGVPSRQKATLDHGELSDRNPYKANIFHINADQMLLAYCHLGREFFSRRYNIGYWAWELAKCPEDWVPVLGIMDEVWAPSRFIQEAFSQQTDIPVEYMPLCVTLPPLKGYSRKHFGLPQKAFVFLYTFDFFSYLDRKNPFAAIRAFKLAFPNKKHRVVLVLKIMNGDQKSPLWSAMMNLIDNDKRIVVMNKVMDRDEVIGLFDVCDCFVSLHRSEGFGRGPAEAMYLGKPVIVTNYSGNTDFTLPDNSCLVDYKLIPVEAGQYPFHQNQVWADPDVDHASWYMRKVFDDHAFSRDIGMRGQEFIHQNFSQDAIGALYAKRLRALGLC